MILRPKAVSDELMANILGKNNLVREYCITLDSIYSGVSKEDCVYVIRKIGQEKFGVYGTIYQTCCGDNCQFIAKWIPIEGIESEDEEIPTLKNVLREANLQQLVAEQGLAPIIREVWTCSKGVFIIMDSLDITLESLVDSLTQEQVDVVNSYSNILTKEVDPLIQKKYANMEKLKVDTSDKPNHIWELRRIVEDNKKVNREKVNYSLPEPKIPPDSKEVESEITQSIIECWNLLKKLKTLGIIHRDAHPGNFMRNKEGRWYLIDFGMARKIEDANEEDSPDGDFEFFNRSVKFFTILGRDYINQVLESLKEN